MPNIFKEVAKISAVELVREQNPWWEDPNAIDLDEYIEVFSSSRFPWIPKLMERISFGSAVYSLRG